MDDPGVCGTCGGSTSTGKWLLSRSDSGAVHVIDLTNPRTVEQVATAMAVAQSRSAYTLSFGQLARIAIDRVVLS